MVAFFVILAVLITFEQSKSYTATNLCYCSLQKSYFRRIFCGTHLRFFSIFRNVLSINRGKYLNSVFLAVFFKIKDLLTEFEVCTGKYCLRFSYRPSDEGARSVR